MKWTVLCFIHNDVDAIRQGSDGINIQFMIKESFKKIECQPIINTSITSGVQGALLQSEKSTSAALVKPLEVTQ